MYVCPAPKFAETRILSLPSSLPSSLSSLLPPCRTCVAPLAMALTSGDARDMYTQDCMRGWSITPHGSPSFARSKRAKETPDESAKETDEFAKATPD